MAKKKTPVVMFYSYKGGTGRTTATANTAAALAADGLDIVCLDLDLEGPGLSIVFGNEAPDLCLQHYLISGESKLSDMLIDLSKKLRSDSISDSGRLLYIPSGADFRETIDYSDGRRMVRDMESLFSQISREYEPDLILLDAPSGYGELSALSMYLSTCLVVLFRYSRQHVLGTVRVSEFVGRFGLQQISVASCVPEDTEGLKAEYRGLLKTVLNIEDPPIEIRDSDELKWKERVLLFEKSDHPDVLTDYRVLAQHVRTRNL